jgi:hypothetical protein
MLPEVPTTLPLTIPVPPAVPVAPVPVVAPAGNAPGRVVSMCVVASDLLSVPGLAIRAESAAAFTLAAVESARVDPPPIEPAALSVVLSLLLHAVAKTNATAIDPNLPMCIVNSSVR